MSQPSHETELAALMTKLRANLESAAMEPQSAELKALRECFLGCFEQRVKSAGWPKSAYDPRHPDDVFQMVANALRLFNGWTYLTNALWSQPQ